MPEIVLSAHCGAHDKPQSYSTVPRDVHLLRRKHTHLPAARVEPSKCRQQAAREVPKLRDLKPMTFAAGQHSCQRTARAVLSERVHALL